MARISARDRIAYNARELLAILSIRILLRAVF
jgi:hypothetical protein